MMARRHAHLLLLAAGLGSVLSAGAVPARAVQRAKEQKQAAAASARQPSGGQIPLRVMLVISDAVRGYKVHEGLVHLDFGGRLAKKAGKNFEEAFSSVQVAAEAPGAAHPPVGIDLIVSIESPHGWDKFSGIFSVTENLTAVFVARRPNGEEIFRMQESASEDGNRAATQDRLGDEVSRKCIQDLLLNESVRVMFSPASVATAPIPKPAQNDSAALAPAGLDLPPPPPWTLPPSASPVPQGNP